MTLIDARRDMRRNSPARGRSVTSSPRPEPAYAGYRERRHMPSLDGLRCLSILSVLWHHSPHASSGPLSHGFLGVDLFFVLSGFLITTLLLRERDATGTISLRAFYMRRVLRIFPLYYAVLLGHVVLLWLTKRGTPMADDFFAVLPWYATYTTNLGPTESLFAHAWSLAVEEQFYLVWPPILVWLGVRRAVPLLGLFLVGVQACDFGVVGAPELARKLAPFSAIALGVLLAAALHSPATFARIARVVAARAFIFVPLAALAALVCVPGDIGGARRLCIHLAMTLLVAAVVVPPDHALASVLRHRAVVHVGTISYGMYLTHQLCLVPVARLIGRDPEHGVWFFLLGTAVTVLVATITFRTFEVHFLRWKTSFARHCVAT
jgi:peptidoglycan/LPS O-acetylase OafA/YrhL